MASAVPECGDDLILDDLPTSVLASMEVRDRSLNGLGMGGELGFEFIAEDFLRWLPGQVLKVAFLGGDAALHRDIADALAEITDACSIRFDFGESGGAFRTWSEADTVHAAEIRVSFNKAGYFSLVGTDSINPAIGAATERVGGRPHQCSLNLGGFHIQRPATWRGTVRHEFMHALGFHHSHQNMRGPCQLAFRWEDDAGYQPSLDARGTYVADAQGRRPGVYTYLAGAPNRWNRAKVDHNLKTEENPRVIVGPFDASSVMLYRFPDLFYRSVPSPCAPVGDGQSLSDGDRRGLQLLYPRFEAPGASERQQRLAAALALPTAKGDGLLGLETMGGSEADPAGVNPWLRAAVDILGRNARVMAAADPA